MAEEVQTTEKSWFPNLGILSNSALEGLTPDVQDQLQREATKRIALGGLLSGGNFGMAFQSAVGTPNDYMQNQSRLMDIKEKQRQQQELDVFRQTYQPKPIDAASRAMAGGGGPTLQAAQNQKTILNTPLDIDAALQSTLGMAGNPAQPRIVENLKAMQTPFVPELGAFRTPGGRIVGTVPLADKSGVTRQYDSQTGQWKYGTGVGAPEAISAITGAETQARETNIPRAEKSSQGSTVFVYPPANPATSLGQRNVGGVTTSGGGVVGGGNLQTANDVALQKVGEKDFDVFTTEVSQAASNAENDIRSNRIMYDIAKTRDGNKFTGLTTEAAAWMRGLPFVGDRFDEMVGNARLFDKEASKQTLAGLNSIKQGANAFEGDVVQKSVSDQRDPALTTKFGAALGIATAEKNKAAGEFIAKYQGNVREARAAWANSPENPRIYNHPLVDQILVDQVAKNPSKPVLPPGFSIVPRNLADGVVEYGFKKPDGKTITPFATMQNGKITYKSFSQ